MSFFKKFKRILPFAAIAAAPFALPAAAGALGAVTAGGALSTLGSVGGALSGVSGIVNAIRGPGDIKINMPAQTDVAPAQATPDKPITRPEAMARPASLGAYAGFTPEQERSALATTGSNVGLGADEDAYYRNLVQRSLIGEGNTFSQDPNALLPVESQYLSRQGINTSSIQELLKQIRGTA